MKKYLLITLIASVLFGCQNKEQLNEVRVAGALKIMMHKGDLSAKIVTDTLLKKYSNLYGLGAVENLKGEILILNSKVYVSKEKNKQVIVTEEPQTAASLLVYTSVDKWQEVSALPAGSLQELETFIFEQAQKSGIDTNKAFPFLVKGVVPELQWHVINWKDGDTEHSHTKHINSGANGTLKNKEVEILGFYSLKHKRIFTHHTSFMHMHFITKDNALSGHIDAISTNKNLVLYLPENFKK